MSESAAKSTSSLLAWYEAMGVDEAIGEEPVDRFAQSAAPPASQGTPRDSAKGAPDTAAGAAPKGALNVPPKASRKARRPAPAPEDVAPPVLEGIETLAELEKAVAAFEGCPLKRTAKNTCLRAGARRPR